MIDICVAAIEAASPVQVNNGASKTGHEDETLQDLASRKGVLQPELAAALSLTPSCLSNDLVGAVELWMGSSLGYGPRGLCLIWLGHLLV